MKNLISLMRIKKRELEKQKEQIYKHSGDQM